ncbi:MAG: DUF1573 domain-containing protein [Niabella sp.]
MKKYLFFIAVFVLGAAVIVKAQKAGPSIDQVIKLSQDKYDIGKVKQNESATFYIEFTNITKKPIVVENVMAGCGCTVPETPKAPILPGKTGQVKVGYNATSVVKFTKDVTIKIKGVQEPKIVYFTGEVVK